MNGLSPSLPLPLATGHEASLEGRVRRIVFDANSGDMRVFELELDDHSVEIVRQYANGVELAPLAKNDNVRVLGKVVHHAKFGRQFSAKDVLKRMPSSPAGVAKVISGKKFKGIGPKAAEKIAQELGPDLISILNRGDPAEMISDLIGPKKAKVLIATWLEDQAGNMTNATLAELGVGPEIRKKIIKQIPDIDTVLLTDPYRIAKEVEGVGFLTADALAQRAGVFRPDSPQRLAVGLAHALELGEKDGHTGLSKGQLVDRACEALVFHDRRALTAIMEKELGDGNITISPNNLVQRKWTGVTETRLARNVAKLARAIPQSYSPISAMRVLASIQKEHGLNDKQFQAVAAGINDSMSCLTGGPGTGKTRTINAIITAIKKIGQLENVEYKILGIAPTGKAADRMQESTGHDCSTFHIALSYDPEKGGFLHDENNPWEVDWVIADELSMVDTRLADAALRAIAAGRTRLIIVGDVDQLPSIDAGRVLHDIIESDICTVTRLDEVYRTSAGSEIFLGAAAIRRGEMPEFGNPGKSDLVFIEMDDPAEAANRIIEMVANTLPRFTGSDPSEIQVLSPGKNSLVGVHALNQGLQNALNPNRPIALNQNGTDLVSLKNGHKARVGDRIICMKTSYATNVYNGDVGIIEDFNVDTESNASLAAHFSKKDLDLDRGYWNNIDLAYALTIHKSQGSEYDVVVIPMTTSHYMMLKRNLLYTAITRAKKLCIIVGSKKALKRAIETLDGTSRQTGLLSRIRKFGELN